MHSIRLPPGVLLVALAVTGTGCGAGSGALEREVASLKRQVTELQARVDRADERLTGVESRPVGAVADVRGPLPDGVMERPALKVVRVGQPGAAPEAPTAAPEAESPSAPSDERVRIVARGDKIYSTTVKEAAAETADATAGGKASR